MKVGFTCNDLGNFGGIKETFSGNLTGKGLRKSLRWRDRISYKRIPLFRADQKAKRKKANISERLSIPQYCSTFALTI